LIFGSMRVGHSAILFMESPSCDPCLFLALYGFGVASFFIRRLYFGAPCILGLTHFSSEVFRFELLAFLGLHLFSSKVFRFEPRAFWGCLFFHQRSFILSPMHFGVASSFIRGLSICASCVLGLPLFSSEVFRSSPMHFGVASFFI
jgi:uncharacterized membrane protein